MLPRICLLLTMLLPWTSSASADDLETWLSKPVIDANLPWHQIRDYCEARVAPLPQVSTVPEWETYANRLRERALNEVVFRGEAAAWRAMPTNVQFLDTIDSGKGYRIRKLRYEAVPGMWIPALLYEPEKLAGKVPVVMNVNGHDGTGKAAKYKQIRCINQAKRGMLALNVEWLGMGQLRQDGNMHYRMNQLDLCGTSGLAPFYLSMSRGLDVLLAHENADPARVAVAGLSGGGWQTITISALDTRVTLSNPVAGYSSFRTRARFLSDLGDSEQTPTDLGMVADYAQLTAMRAPRPTLLTFNLKDQCCFASPHALPPLLEAAGPIYELYGKPDHLRSHVNEDPGTHNFEIDNRQALYRSIGDFFYTGAAFDPAEIPCEDEVRSYDDLLVELPEANADLHTLAMRLHVGLPRQALIPTDPAALASWRTERRRTLRQIVRARDWSARSESAEGSTLAGGIQVTQWKLDVGSHWTLPAVSFEPATARRTVLVLADAGRASAAEQIRQQIAQGNRVIALDPFYMGESKIAQRDFLFALLLATIGDRPLGVQAAQINAVADWASREFSAPVDLLAIGPRTSLMALTAAALDDQAADHVRLNGSLHSLHQVLEQNISVNQQPEMFCFGLLEEFDIPQLRALAGSGRVTTE